jgi:glycosyltransferase involved in cell wall biosynthesis
MFRVLDGIIQSDLITILSDSMRWKLEMQLNEMIGSCRNLMDKVISFEPSISETEILPYTEAAKILHEDKIIITFPGRLAKGEEGRTNWDKFIEAILQLRNKRNDFEVYFTDPNNALNNDVIEQQHWTHTIPKNRHTFLNLLNGTDIIVSLMDIEGFGGISIREALLFNCRPVIPYVHEYKKMIEDKTYPGFVQKPITVENLVRCLDWAVSQGHKPSPFYSYEGKQFTVEEQFKKLLPRIEEIL